MDSMASKTIDCQWQQALTKPTWSETVEHLLFSTSFCNIQRSYLFLRFTSGTTIRHIVAHVYLYRVWTL